MAVDVGSAVGYLDLDISGFLSGLKSAQSEADTASKNIATKIGNNLQSAGKSITSAGSTLTKSVTAPIVGVGAAAFKFSSDFESAMAQVKTIADPTAKSIGAIKDEIIDLSNETGMAASDLAAATYQAISAGVDTASSVEFVANASKLATAGFTDTTTAVDALTTIINAYGLSAEDATHISDVLISTQNKGKTTVNELAATIGKVIPTANAMGVSLEDLGVAYSYLTAGGIATAESTTYLNGMFNELGKSGTNVSDVLKKRTGKSFQELMESGTSLREVLEILEAEAQETGVGFNDLWGSQEAGKAALALLNTSTEEYNETLKDFQTTVGDTETAYGIMAETTEYKLNVALQNGKNALIQLGDTLKTMLLPFIERGAELLQKLNDWLTSLSSEEKEQIVKLATIAAVIGPILLIIGKLTSGIGNLITNVGKITSLFGNFGGAVSSVAGPAKSAAGGVGGLAKSAVGLLAAGAGILLASAGLSLLAISAVKLAEAGWPAIAVMGGLVIALAGLAAGASVIAPTLTVGAVGLIAFGAAITLVGVGILAATSGMALLAAQLPVISNYGAQAAANILNLGGSMIAFGTGATIVGAGLITIGVGATSAAAGITLLGVGVIALTASIIALGAGFAVCGAGLAIISAAMKSTATSVKSIEESAGKAAESLKDMITSVDVVKAGFNGLDTIVTKAVNSIASIFTSSGPKASSSALSMATSITKNINTGLIPIPTNTIMIMTQMNEAITSGFNSSVSYIRSLSNQSYSWGSDMIDGIIRGIKSKYGAVSSAVNGVANIIHSRLHFSRPDEGPLRDYETWMPDFMEGLAKGINDNSHLVKSAVQNVASDMKLDNIDTRKTEVFTKDDTENLKTYNITLINTIGLYKQLIEQMKICSQYSGIVSGDNGLLNSAVINTKEKVHEKFDNNDNKNEERNKPDMLTIPISIGDEQIENVVVDLLRREVRT